MPEPTVPTPPTKDVTSVKTLVTSVSALAAHLDLTVNAIYRWIKVNRVPAKFIFKVANFYDVDVPYHLCTSDKKNTNKPVNKPRETLPLCLEVKAGRMTAEEAATRLNVNTQSIRLVLAYWGDSLGTLYTTLCDLEAGTIKLQQAADALGVTVYSIHAMRKKYGFPVRAVAAKVDRPIVALKAAAKVAALNAIAGRATLEEAAEQCGQSWRTVHRAIAKLSPKYGLVVLTHWPASFRQAYVVELEGKPQTTAEKLWEYAVLHKISLKKRPRAPSKVVNWRSATARRMLIAVLTDELDLETLAVTRGADPLILAQMFGSELRNIGLSYDEVKNADPRVAIAVAELLSAITAAATTPRERMIEALKAAKEQKND